jgi:D-serine deaminase-like pyridoxal phosphate-dependent protein
MINGAMTNEKSIQPGSTDKSMVSEVAWDERYRVPNPQDIITPALLLYPEIIESNISRTVDLLGGNADRWRVHIKTAKLAHTVGLLVAHGIRNFKCATTLELRVACESGAADVLVAYPHMGANARRVREIAEQFPGIRVSTLVENEEQTRQWQNSRVGVFVDINPGMDRTGIQENHKSEAVQLARAIGAAGLDFRGLHYYDGQYASTEEPERTSKTHQGYDRLLEIVSAMEAGGLKLPEIVTAGTPTFPCSLSYQRFRNASFVHRISPGTIVYCDATSMVQLPESLGYQPAALVLARVVSRPRAGLVTCDAGHKGITSDAGIPTCVVVGHAELTPLRPSEEHLPIAVREGARSPQAGDELFLLPRHICPSVNNFDEALLIRNGKIESMEKVSARGHESPLPENTASLTSP